LHLIGLLSVTGFQPRRRVDLEKDCGISRGHGTPTALLAAIFATLSAPPPGTGPGPQMLPANAEFLEDVGTSFRLQRFAEKMVSP
jgi:hypothetical protein